VSDETRIREAVRKVLGGIAPEIDLDAVPPDANLRRACDLDSMDFQNFVIGMCKELGVEIPERDVGRLTTLAGCMQYLGT